MKELIKNLEELNRKAEKGGGPEGRPEKGAVAGLWKADLHLHMAFPEIG